MRVKGGIFVAGDTLKTNLLLEVGLVKTTTTTTTTLMTMKVVASAMEVSGTYLQREFPRAKTLTAVLFELR